jgi:hypothetical protein
MITVINKLAIASNVRWAFVAVHESKMLFVNSADRRS